MTTSEATFFSIPDPAPAITVAGVGATLLAPIATRGHLGFGLLTPFQRAKSSDFAAGGGPGLVLSALRQILGTRADDGRVAGELPWRPDFGAVIYKLAFLALDETYGALARTYITSAIARWEPRARVTGFSATRVVDAAGNRALLRLTVDIVDSASPGNILYRNQTLDIPLA
jgi:phage baseplate assembly protein W